MTPRLSVVVPAFCEQDRIGATVGRLRRALPADGVEIVVVDDGSPDATAEAARRAGADQVLRLPANRGKGAAVRAGMVAAGGRVRAFTDADLSYPPEQLIRLLEEVEAGCDVVVGSRRHVDTTTLVRARRLREASGRVFSLLTRLVLLQELRDTQCGLKAFSADAALLLFSRSRIDSFAFDVELFYLAERFGLRVCEVSVQLANSEVSSVSLGLDAARMLRDLFRIRRLAAAGAYEVEGSERRPLLGCPGPHGDGGR
ncbi:MAG: glycosyltransferase family 2 protein [Actinomycetota bacterium]|nr:glycosyltransferase family 2 protein [Actinomycetota bacterium]